MTKQITKAARNLLKTNHIQLINQAPHRITLRIKGKNYILEPAGTLKTEGYTPEIKRLLRDGILGIYGS